MVYSALNFAAGPCTTTLPPNFAERAFRILWHSLREASAFRIRALMSAEPGGHADNTIVSYSFDAEVNAKSVHRAHNHRGPGLQQYIGCGPTASNESLDRDAPTAPYHTCKNSREAGDMYTSAILANWYVLPWSAYAALRNTRSAIYLADALPRIQGLLDGFDLTPSDVRPLAHP